MLVSGAIAVGRHRVTGTSTYRNPWDQAFAGTSYWNIGVGTSAQWSNAGDSDTQALTNETNWSWNTGDQNSGWLSPAWIGSSTDPLMTYTASAGDPPCNNPSFASFRCPSGAWVQAGAGVGGFSDQWFTVFDKTNPRYAFTSDTSVYPFQGQGNVVTFSGNTGHANVYYGSVFDLTSNGVTTPTFQSWSNMGNTGIRDFGIGGVLRSYDINRAKAGLPIQHGFRLGMRKEVMHSPAGYYQNNIPWPTWVEDYGGPNSYTGPILYGSTIGIPLVSRGGPDFTKMGLSAPGLALCQAVQNYGCFIRDQAGNPSIPCEQGVDYNWVGQAASDFNNAARPYLRIMRNQSSNGASGTVNGGGAYPVTQIPDFYPALGIGNGRVGAY